MARILFRQSVRAPRVWPAALGGGALVEIGHRCSSWVGWGGGTAAAGLLRSERRPSAFEAAVQGGGARLRGASTAPSFAHAACDHVLWSVPQRTANAALSQDHGDRHPTGRDP